MTPETINALSPILLASLSVISGVLVYMTARQNAVLKSVKEQTDGLATKLAEQTGVVEHARGVKETTDEASALVASDARQTALIVAAVARMLADQATTTSVAAPTDPGPVVASELGQIKAVVKDVQPRVVAIEDATMNRDAAVEQIATSADERLTKLEDDKKAP